MRYPFTAFIAPVDCPVGLLDALLPHASDPCYVRVAEPAGGGGGGASFQRWTPGQAPPHPALAGESHPARIEDLIVPKLGTGPQRHKYTVEQMLTVYASLLEGGSVAAPSGVHDPRCRRFSSQMLRFGCTSSTGPYILCPRSQVRTLFLPDAEVRLYLVYLKYWTLNSKPLVLLHPNFSIKAFSPPRPGWAWPVPASKVTGGLVPLKADGLKNIFWQCKELQGQPQGRLAGRRAGQRREPAVSC